MRLFGKVDGAVDRYERASWLTCPFDLALTTATLTHPVMLIGEINTTGVIAGVINTTGTIEGQAV